LPRPHPTARLSNGSEGTPPCGVSHCQGPAAIAAGGGMERLLGLLRGLEPPPFGTPDYDRVESATMEFTKARHKTCGLWFLQSLPAGEGGEGTRH
jgi:hypothetical protein